MITDHISDAKEKATNIFQLLSSDTSYPQPFLSSFGQQISSKQMWLAKSLKAAGEDVSRQLEDGKDPLI